MSGQAHGIEKHDSVRGTHCAGGKPSARAPIPRHIWAFVLVCCAIVQSHAFRRMDQQLRSGHDIVVENCISRVPITRQSTVPQLPRAGQLLRTSRVVGHRQCAGSLATGNSVAYTPLMLGSAALRCELERSAWGQMQHAVLTQRPRTSAPHAELWNMRRRTSGWSGYAHSPLTQGLAPARLSPRGAGSITASRESASNANAPPAKVSACHKALSTFSERRGLTSQWQPYCRSGGSC
jgi:hypothetical protein